MSTTTTAPAATAARDARTHDAIVIGAGIAGMYQL